MMLHLAILIISITAVLADEEIIFNSYIVRQSDSRAGSLSPANSSEIVTDLKVYNEHLFWATPRWTEKSPITLGISKLGMPELVRPYPNWKWQEIDNCMALQSVRGFEIDPEGRIWVLDSGKSTKSIGCTAQLIVFDSKNKGIVSYRYKFSNLTRPSSSNLGSIVLDHEEGGFAYIADDDEENPGIIVVSIRRNSAWKILRTNIVPNLGGVKRVDQTHIRSIVSLSPASGEERILYYTPLYSLTFYNISVERLQQNNVVPGDWKQGNWSKHLFAVTMDANGQFYEVEYHDERVQNCLFLDGEGYGWFFKSVPSHRDGYRLFDLKKFKIDSKNYQYYQHGAVPVLPYLNKTFIID